MDGSTIAEKSAFKPTEEDIDALTYRDGIRMLRKLKVETNEMKTLEDIKTFLRLRFINTHDRPNMTFRAIEPEIKENFRKREDLREICELIEHLSETGGAPFVEIENDLEPSQHHVWRNKLMNLHLDMQNGRTPILIAGETGSGKSSLINLMIGEQLLPEAEQPCTGVICTIQNGDKRMVRLKKNSEEFETLALDDGNDSEQKAKWEHFITSRDDMEEQSKKRAEFFCPLDYLGESVYFVDSPGIRETTVLNDVLHDYLPKCSAFIIVLMSDNCTGFNEPVERFIRNIRKRLQDYNIGRLDGASDGLVADSVTADSVIFVFNRWDKVEDYETKERTRQLKATCLQKLARLWPEARESKNVFFMSVTKYFAMIRNKANPPDEFVRFQSALNTLVPKCLNTRLVTAYNWLENLVRSFLDLTRTKVNFARHRSDEKEMEAEVLRALLARLNQTFDQRLSDLDRQIAERRTQLRQRLMKHLRSTETLERMCDFENDHEHYDDEEISSDLPEGDDFESVGIKLQIFFIRRIDREIRFWNERNAYEYKEVCDENCGGVIRRLSLNHEATEFSLFHAEIKELCRNTFEEIERQAQVLNDLLKSEGGGIQFDPNSMIQPKSEFLSNLEKVFFGMTAVIWIPLVLVGGAISFPVIASIMTFDKIGNKNKLKSYNSDRSGLAKQWLKSFVKKSFNENLLDDLIYEAILIKIQEVQNSVKNYKDPAIRKFKDRIDHLSKDTRKFSCMKRRFNPILGRIEDILKDVYGFHAQYLKKYDYEKTDFEGLRDNAISMGAFGDIYRSTNKTLKREVAVKIIKQSIRKGAAFDIYMEEIAWRRLCQENHNNILKLYGLVYFDENEPRIGFVMELCDGTLSDLMKNNAKLLPYKQKTDFAKEDSFKRTLNLAIQLTEGLAVVHKINFVHRDLKLDNILYVKENNGFILKLCDFGLSKGRTDVTTTTAGTTLYMSPEVLSQHGCSAASDIYSLGLMLWEMYHGLTVFTKLMDNNMFELANLIRNGEAKLDYPDEGIPYAYHALIEGCVSFDARERPKAENVRADLLTMMSNLSATFGLKKQQTEPVGRMIMSDLHQKAINQ